MPGVLCLLWYELLSHRKYSGLGRPSVIIALISNSYNKYAKLEIAMFIISDCTSHISKEVET